MSSSSDSELSRTSKNGTDGEIITTVMDEFA